MPFPNLFGPLSAREAELLATCLTPVAYEPGATLFAAGDEGDAAYLIDEGEVRIEIDRPEVDSENVLRFLKAGAVLGEVALLDRMPRSASAVAHTAVRARRLDAAALDALAEGEPRLVLAIVRALARNATSKLRLVTTELAEHLFGDPPDPEVERMVADAGAAQAEFAGWDEARVDRLLGALTEVFVANAEAFARAAVEETHVGNVPDKTFKNRFASAGVYRSLVGQVGAGALGTDDARRITEIACPVGVVFGLVPMTNPVATAYFKTLIALKARNALILSFHHAALRTGNQVGELIRGVLEQHGAPVAIVQWVKERSSRKKTVQFMTHPGVSLVLATGGAAMVQAAYSSGTPALGVGQGNAPCWIAPDADLAHAAWSVVLSKSFDNGLICGSEHNLVVDVSVRDAFVAALEAQGAAVLTPEEAARFTAAAVDPKTGAFHGRIVGQAAERIAKVVGVHRDHPIRLLVVPSTWSGEPSAFAGEKMAPVLSLFTVRGDDEAVDLCRRLLAYMGTGHTAIVHTRDEARIQRFGAAMPASRVLVNSPGSQGVVGITSGLLPSLTLGCGTFGGNSTTDNVTWRNLTNVKRLARFLEPDLSGA